MDFPIANAKDVTSKITYKIDNKNKLSFTNYFSWGKLRFFEEDPDQPNQLNEQIRNSQSVQWQSQFTNRLYSKLSITHSQVKSQEVRNIQNFRLRQDFTFFPRSEDVIKIGGEINRKSSRSSRSITLYQFAPFFN